jgi:hypothetical protein
LSVSHAAGQNRKWLLILKTLVQNNTAEITNSPNNIVQITNSKKYIIK